MHKKKDNNEDVGNKKLKEGWLQVTMMQGVIVVGAKNKWLLLLYLT